MVCDEDHFDSLWFISLERFDPDQLTCPQALILADVGLQF